MRFEHPESTPSEISETEKIDSQKEQSLRDEVIYPHVDAVLALLEKEFKDAEEEAVDREAIKDIMWEYLEEHLDNAAIYSSEKKNAAFPYTAIDTAEFAKKLYTKYTGKEISQDALKQNDGKEQREFIFTSIPPVQSIEAGSIFGFMEEEMHQAIKDLPPALEKLKNGEEPDAHKVYNLGSPTNEFGTMSQEFLDTLKDDKAFEEFGELYADFIESTLPKQDRNKIRLYLYGQSTGASFAAETGSRLMKDAAATQSHEDEADKDIPFMQVRLDMPVGSSDIPKGRKRWQIPVGFLADAGFTVVADKYMKPIMAKDKDFLSTTKRALAEKGFTSNVTDEQLKLKMKASLEVLENLRNGTPIPQGLKVTKVIGGRDVLMWSGKMRREMDEQAEAHGGSLGEGLISKEENQRAFGIKSMHHAMPYFRHNELKRFAAASRALRELKKD